MRRVMGACCWLMLLAACALRPEQPTIPHLEKVAFDDLPDWQDDTLSGALPALQKSCAVLISKKQPGESAFVTIRTTDWTAACKVLQNLRADDLPAVRRALMTVFTPYRVAASDTAGLFTGYYEPTLRGAVRQGGPYQTPLYQRPKDLITVDLGAFKADWQGKHLVGKVSDGKLVPYDTRQQIMKGSLQGCATPLLWIDDPVDAFFLAVQGAGRVRMEDGRVLRIGYDGANGHDYLAIGRWLVDHNELAPPVTMQSIRVWLRAHPDRAAEVMNTNPSYVFFRALSQKGEGPTGAEGVSLTPERSMAVDPAFVPLGAPLWLDTLDATGRPLRRLMVAQDTGGAIKGAVRGDVFWGAGADAEAQAGAMQSAGALYLLLPAGAVLHDAR